MTGSLQVAQRSEFDPLGAGALLASVVVLCIGVGALIGLALGNVGYGIAGGAVAGVPASVAAVIYRYRDGG